MKQTLILVVICCSATAVERQNGLNTLNTLKGIDPIGNWVISQLPGSLKQISFDGRTLVGVNSIGQIYFATQDLTTNPKWKLVRGTGRLSQVVVLGSRIYGVDFKNDVWCAFSLEEDLDWINIPGKLKQISYDGILFAGSGIDNQVILSETNQVADPKWRTLNGQLNQLHVFGKTIYGICSASHQLYKGVTTGGNDPKWVNLMGNFTHISYDGIQIAGIRGTDNRIVITNKSNPTPTEWELIPEPNGPRTWKYVHLFAGTIYAIDTLGRIFHIIQK